MFSIKRRTELATKSFFKVKVCSVAFALITATFHSLSPLRVITICTGFIDSSKRLRPRDALPARGLGALLGDERLVDPREERFAVLRRFVVHEDTDLGAGGCFDAFTE